MFDEQREGSEQEEHLERGEVARLHAVQVVANHVAWAQQHVAHRTEDTAVVHVPDVEEKVDGLFQREAVHRSRLTAAWTEVAYELRAAARTFARSVG